MDGNTVQYTYHIGCKETQTYTINAYLTKCSLLINGKNVEKFIDDDIKEIHSIMSQTKINGVKIDALVNEYSIVDLFVLSSFFFKDFSAFNI
jgi:hypothetical protein